MFDHTIVRTLARTHAHSQMSKGMLGDFMSLICCTNPWFQGFSHAMSRERGVDLIDSQIREIELQKIETKKELETLMMRLRVAESSIKQLASSDTRRQSLVENAAELLRSYRDVSNTLILSTRQIQKLRDTKSNLQKTTNMTKTISVLEATMPLLQGQTKQLEAARAAILASNAVNTQVASGVVDLNSVFAEGAGSIEMVGASQSMGQSKVSAEYVLDEIGEILSPSVRFDFMTSEPGELVLPDVPNAEAARETKADEEREAAGTPAVAMSMSKAGTPQSHVISVNGASSVSRRPKPLRSVDDDNDE
jgi:hypothetical protein